MEKPQATEKTPAKSNTEEMHPSPDLRDQKGDDVQPPVPDGKEELLGSTDLEKRVKEFIESKKNPSVKKTDDPDKEFKETAELALEYSRQIKLEERTNTVTNTERWLQLGLIFIIMKNDIKTTQGPKWIEWFKANFEGRQLRTVQVYMRLAKISGIIYYAAIGKNNLVRIVRQLSPEDKQTADPVGAFLKRKGIDFDREKGVDVQKLKSVLATTSGQKAKSFEKRTENLIKDIKSAIAGPDSESFGGLTEGQAIDLAKKLEEIAELLQPTTQGQ
jgi:hypothetical protein